MIKYSGSNEKNCGDTPSAILKIVADVIWLKYCRWGVKQQTINQ